LCQESELPGDGFDAWDSSGLVLDDGAVGPGEAVARGQRNARWGKNGRVGGRGVVVQLHELHWVQVGGRVVVAVGQQGRLFQS